MLRTAPRTMIGNRYELQREVARGGMGSVWVAKDLKLKRQVAIKVMVPMWVETQDAVQRFQQEAMAVAQLQSPHVVQIFDYGVEQSCPYIVMELLEGEDLRQRLQRQERLDLETSSRIMIQGAKALSAAHGAGIVHRDLKPGNVFLVRSAEEELVKLLDFGVAKVDQRQDAHDKEETRAGTLLGTPQYMSPEQSRGAPDIDHRADLWSLAVILYRCLTGQLPFIGKNAADVIVRICTKTAPAPTELVPDLPPEVDRFFERALARAPDDRFQDARQMAVAFARIAPATFPSLTLPGTSLEGADSHLQRVQAAQGDWDSVRLMAAGERSGIGALPGPLAPGLPGTTGAASPGAPSGMTGPAGGLEGMAAMAAASPEPVSAAAPVAAPYSSSTLGSGLADTSSVEPRRRGRGRMVAAVLGGLAVATVLFLFTLDALGPSPDRSAAGNTSDGTLATAPPIAAAASSATASAEATPAASAAAAASADPEEEPDAGAEPEETAKPSKPTPRPVHRPRPRPTVAEPDPFSERL